MHHLIKQPIHHAINQSSNQSIKQSINALLLHSGTAQELVLATCLQGDTRQCKTPFVVFKEVCLYYI